jgi:hypothetical protein
MLKLTTEEGCVCYVNPAAVFSVHVGKEGQTTILSTNNNYLGVKESAEEVKRMMDEANGAKSLRETLDQAYKSGTGMGVGAEVEGYYMEFIG